MKGVIYARYSSDNQREESIEGQLRECKEYAERNDIMILGTYIDRALSAKTDNRPEFQHMIKDSAKGLFDVVLVWKLDRFARNRYDSARYKNILKKNGVKVISARENISEGSEGIILEAMLEGYAEYYSAELSEKVIRGLTDNALKCKYNGGTVPMGYYIDEQQYYQIDPKTAPVVLEMFTRYSEGATMQELVNLLNSRGMRSIRGGKITLNIMNHLLKNRRYMGEYSYRDVVKEDGIPAIVPKDLFERVQERLAKNKKAPACHKAEDDYLLTTKLYCGKCGSFMVGESGTSHTMKVHRYYRCVNTKKKKLCDKKAVKKDWIEDLVVSYTMKAIMNDKVMERLIDTLMELQKRESTDLPLLKKQLAETEKGINNMLNAIQAGIFTPSTKQRLDELEEIKSQLEISILQEEMHKPMLTREQIAFFIYRFRKFDVTKREQRQRLIDSFVNAVYLYEDKIILTFNYKDGSKTITLAEVEGSDLSVLGALESPYFNLHQQKNLLRADKYILWSGQPGRAAHFLSLKKRGKEMKTRKDMNFVVREMCKEEYGLLSDFLYEAIFVPDGVEPPPKSILNRPELQVYISGFGTNKNDKALAAEIDGKTVGVIWARIMKDYGHIDESTPSLAMSVLKEYRGRGIGTALLKHMLIEEKTAGHAKLSLSVQKDNYAVTLYRKAGFMIIGESDEEYIMAADLSRNFENIDNGIRFLQSDGGMQTCPIPFVMKKKL